MAEIWIACDQPLALSQLFVSDHENHFFYTLSREKSVESA